MKKFNVLVALALLVCFAVPAFAQTEPGENIVNPVGQTAAVTIRSAAEVNNAADVLSTTFTLSEPQRCKAILYYIAFTTGSLTSATFKPAGAMDNSPALGPAATGYYGNVDRQISVTGSGNYLIRCPINYDGGSKFHGIYSRGVGTQTGSSAVIKYKLEY